MKAPHSGYPGVRGFYGGGAPSDARFSFYVKRSYFVKFISQQKKVDSQHSR